MEENQDIIKAPFTKEQVIAINTFQFSGYMHPFTCCSPDDIPECERRNKKSEGLLLAGTGEGLTCSCGKYKQDWVHKFMADPETIKRFQESNFYKLTSTKSDNI